MENKELYRMQNGKHKDELITRVPLSYLKWMIGCRHQHAAHAAEELKRRGVTDLPTIEVSGHAIDRASLRVRKIWHNDRHQLPFNSTDEGLHSWMVRRGYEAFGMLAPGKDQVIHVGVVWTFAMDGAWPIIQSVWSEK